MTSCHVLSGLVVSWGRWWRFIFFFFFLLLPCGWVWMRSAADLFTCQIYLSRVLYLTILMYRLLLETDPQTLKKEAESRKNIFGFLNQRLTYFRYTGIRCRLFVCFAFMWKRLPCSTHFFVHAKRPPCIPSMLHSVLYQVLVPYFKFPLSERPSLQSIEQLVFRIPNQPTSLSYRTHRPSLTQRFLYPHSVIKLLLPHTATQNLPCMYVYISINGANPASKTWLAS